MKIRFDFIIKILDFVHDMLCPFFRDNETYGDEKPIEEYKEESIEEKQE